MKSIFCFLTSLTLVLSLLCTVSFCLAEEKQSLYQRLGKYDVIAGIVDDFLSHIRSDPQFSRFTGRGQDSLKRARQLLVDQLCALSGGPCIYIGRDMKTAHAGLAITESEWEANMKLMAASIDKFKVPKKEKEELLAIINGLRGSIVEKAKGLDQARHVGRDKKNSQQ